MPQQREGLTHQPGGEDPIEGLLQRLKRHLPLVGAVREVAVRTVKIAERRRLDNQKFQGANLAGGSHRQKVAETAAVAESTVAESTVAESTVAESTVAESTVAESTVAETAIAESAKPVTKAADAREVEELSVLFTGRAEATCIQLRGPRLDIEVGWLGVLGGAERSKGRAGECNRAHGGKCATSKGTNQRTATQFIHDCTASGCRVPIEGPNTVALSRPPTQDPSAAGMNVYRRLSRWYRDTADRATPKHAIHGRSLTRRADAHDFALYDIARRMRLDGRRVGLHFLPITIVVFLHWAVASNCAAHVRFRG